MENSKLWKQGAEAKLYRHDFYGRPCIIKERFNKKYRHPSLNAALSTQRVKSEVRANLRCRFAGIPTPVVYMVNLDNSSIYMEEIRDATMVKDYICQVQEKDKHMACATLTPLAKAIGAILCKMHENNIIHGDLTTSNLLLQGDPSDLKLVLIDFGLSSFEASAEDKSVDLYVLERAFLSSHPNTQQLFDAVLQSYCLAAENSGRCKETLAKLDEVRLRGRKRTMVG